MGQWLNAVASSPQDDYTPIAGVLDHFDDLYEEMRKHLDVRGTRLLDVAAEIAGLAETVYASWSEIKAICEILDLRLVSAMTKARKFYTEGYPKSLTAVQAERYALGHPPVVEVSEVLIHMQYLLNKWEGLSKGVAQLSFQIRLIGDMRRADMTDATI